jgi:hypothetical protein
MSSATNSPQKPPPDSDVVTISTTDSGLETHANEPENVRETESETGDIDEAESSIEVDVGTSVSGTLASVLIIVVC